jgi:dodecin
VATGGGEAHHGGAMRAALLTARAELTSLGRNTHFGRRPPMSSVARVIEISAQSKKSFEDAIEAGLTRAEKTLRNVTSAWVKEQRVDVVKGKITGYQVNLLVTFILD